MYRQQQSDASAAAEQQFTFSANSSNFNYSPFSAGGLSGIVDPGFQSSPQHLTPKSTIGRRSHGSQPSMDSQGGMRPPSSSISPRYGSPAPGRSDRPSFIPTDRSLPSTDVTEDTITDAYVAFILYCNPNFALDVETTTLRTNFQTPPKADNKDFEIFRLYELIQRFDSKEIKTWSQLALELGVEAPDTSKGQSVQKVQQYSVRLKRWMRAMHVDAFFEYLMGKEHDYFNKVPHPSDPVGGRDGVAAEEDLAIRALDPSFRPKRGRRRNSEVDHEEEIDNESTNKQSEMTKEVPHAAFGLMPFSAYPGDSNDTWTAASAVTPSSFAPWAQRSAPPQSTVNPSAPSQLRWHLNDSSRITATPHPMTAGPTSMAAHIDAAFDNEPKSAMTPSRKRRKHGPAVSSAWPSSNAPGAKPKGRPPASRNVQDGPFSTFPVGPADGNTPTFSAPVAQMDIAESDAVQSESSTRPPLVSRQSDGTGKRGRLSLQVPAHTGGPVVRLATPPRVLVNGETEDTAPIPSPQTHITEPGGQMPTPASTKQKSAPSNPDTQIPGFAFEALKRVVASDLLRAEIVGRQFRLTGDEAKGLADAILDRFTLPREDSNDSKDDLARLTAASWLGVGEQLNVPLGPAVGHHKRIKVTRLRVDEDGYEEIVSPEEAVHPGHGQLREVFDLSWTVTMGGCSGSFELKGLSASTPPYNGKGNDMHDMMVDTWVETARKIGVGDEKIKKTKDQFVARPERFQSDRGQVGDDGVDWKSRYRALEFGSKMAKGENDRYKQRLVEAVLDTLLD